MKPSSKEGPFAVEKLGEFVSRLTISQVPDFAATHARLAVLDTLGAGLAGSSTSEAHMIRQAAAAFSGTGEAPVWGSTEFRPPATAAFVNGATGHILEVDDFGGCGHSGVVVVPAVMAVGAVEQCTGETALAAVVAGYEVASRITVAAGGYAQHNQIGWHSTGTCGTFGAAAAASRVLGLDATATAHAIAIAGALASGTWSFAKTGASTKRLNAGRSAENGVAAAYLAREGSRGPIDLLEAPHGGFLELHVGELADIEAASAGLGTEWHITRSGFKIHAACRGVHGVLDAVLALRAEHQLTVDSIAGIEVVASERVIRQFGHTTVSNTLEAQLSMPYAIAVAMLHGQAGINEFREDYVTAEAPAEVMKLISFTTDEKPSRHATSVAIRRTDGSQIVRKVAEAKGGPSDPLSSAEVIDKFNAIVGTSLAEEAKRQLVELTQSLESVTFIGELTPLLVASSSPSQQ